MKVNLVMQGLPCCGPRKSNLENQNNSIQDSSKSFGAVAEVSKPIARGVSSTVDAAAAFARTQARLGAKFRAMIKGIKHSDGTPRFPNEVSFSNRKYYLKPEHESALKLILDKTTPTGEFWVKEEDDIHRIMKHVNAKTLPILESVLRLLEHSDRPHEVAAILWNANYKDLHKVVQGLALASKNQSGIYRLGLTLSGS